MNTNRISAAQVIDAANCEYAAPGNVVRVFDTNGFDQLVPLSFDISGEGSRFKLRNLPHGVVRVEHAYSGAM